MHPTISAVSSDMPAPSARPASPQVGDRVRGLRGSSEYARGVAVVTKLLPSTSDVGYAAFPAMEVAWETPYIPNPKKPRVVIRTSIVKCALFAVVEAAKAVDEPAAARNDDETLQVRCEAIEEPAAATEPVVEKAAAVAASVAIGARVRSTATGKTGHVKGGADALRVVVVWEGSGEEGTVYASSLEAAPELAPARALDVMLEHVSFPRAIAARAMLELCLEELKSANLAALSRKTGIAARKLRAWRKEGAVPAASLQQLFEALAITIRAVEERAESIQESTAAPAVSVPAITSAPEAVDVDRKVVPLFRDPVLQAAAEARLSAKRLAGEEPIERAVRNVDEREARSSRRAPTPLFDEHTMRIREINKIIDECQRISASLRKTFAPKPTPEQLVTRAELDALPPLGSPIAASTQDVRISYTPAAEVR